MCVCERGMGKSAGSMNALIFVLIYRAVCVWALACVCVSISACGGFVCEFPRSRGEDKPLNVCIVPANELKQNGREQRDEKEKET